jgi:hypothetical protein
VINTSDTLRGTTVKKSASTDSLTSSIQWMSSMMNSGVDQRRQPTPARVGIDVGRLDARLVNAQEVVDQQQILGIGVGLSVATLLAGSRVKPAAAARLLDEVITPNALNQRLWVLSSSDYWRSICAALIRLSDYLNNYGGDVDYRRRRHLNYSELLPEDACHSRYALGPAAPSRHLAQH